MTPAARPINLTQKLASFSNWWSPRAVAAFNGHDVMVVKADGFFLARKGELDVEPRDRAERRTAARRGEVETPPIESPGASGAGGFAAAEKRKDISLSVTSRL